jgi:hypothetical protein
MVCLGICVKAGGTGKGSSGKVAFSMTTLPVNCFTCAASFRMPVRSIADCVIPSLVSPDVRGEAAREPKSLKLGGKVGDK